MAPIQDTLDVLEKQNGRSKTLPGDDYHSGQSKLSAKLSSFSSKTKPIAPKIKSSVTIGVASGVEALRAMNCVMPSYSNSDVSARNRDNTKLLHEIKQQNRADQAEQMVEAPKAEAPKRPPITRIITSDNSFQSSASSATSGYPLGADNNRNK